MFIKAKPRFVSNGLGTFVPLHRAELMHQRLVEMTNNEVNAWNVFRPVGSSTSDNWDQHLDDFGNNENFSLHALYGDYYQDTTSVSRLPATPLPKANSYTTSYQDQDQYQPKGKLSVIQPKYHETSMSMNCLEKPGPMFGDPYAYWGASQGRGSFAEFSKCRSGAEYPPSQCPNEVDMKTFTPASSLAQPQASYNMDASGINCGYELGYTNYSSATTPLNSQTLASFEMQTALEAQTKSTWWSDTSRGTSNSIYRDNFGTQLQNDGLPNNFQTTQQHLQQYGNVWTTNTTPSNWLAQQANISTISPKLLTRNVSSAALSATGSSHGASISQTSSSAESVVEDGSDFSGPETFDAVERSQPTRLAYITDSRKALPVLPSNDFTSKKVPRTPLPKGKQSQTGRASGGLSYSASLQSPMIPPKSNSSALKKAAVPKRLEPKPVDPQAWQGSSKVTAQAMHPRDAKDDFLVKSKLAGMSYKDIRRQGNFTEAESTLRGRFRTLTKHKTARVRKPEWNENDIRLLKRAVRKLAQGSNPSKLRVPWKQVADYITNNGGSYHFGNATCRKQWDELQEGL